MKSPHTNKYTLASRYKPPTNQSLQESIYFSTPRRILFFSPSLRCFNFFATAQQPMTDEYLNRTMQGTNRQELDIDEEARTGNSGFKKLAVQWIIEHLFSALSVVLADSFVLRNPPLRQAAKRYGKG